MRNDAVRGAGVRRVTIVEGVGASVATVVDACGAQPRGADDVEGVELLEPTSVPAEPPAPPRRGVGFAARQG